MINGELLLEQRKRKNERKSLNRVNGNMYPWVTHTWNPIAGRCQHDCQYCYMKKSFLGKLEKYKGEVRLSTTALETDLGSNNIIFVGSATDIFGEWVPSNLIEEVLDYCRNFSNTYLFQSKNPRRFVEFLELLPKNSIIGTTIETNRNYNISKAPPPAQRYQDFLTIKYPRKMVSIEPIMDFDLEELLTWIKKINPIFVSIGADSKNNELIEPNPDKIDKLIKSLNTFTEVKVKKNLKRLCLF